MTCGSRTLSASRSGGSTNTSGGSWAAIRSNGTRMTGSSIVGAAVASTGDGSGAVTAGIGAGAATTGFGLGNSTTGFGLGASTTGIGAGGGTARVRAGAVSTGGGGDGRATSGSATTSGGATATATAAIGVGTRRTRGAGSGSTSGSRVGRSNTAVAGPGAHVEGAGARRTESQSGVEAASGRAGTRDMAPPYPDSARAVIRNGTTRLRQASNTSGAATRWMSGPGANAHNARRMAPSKDIGYVNDSVT